MSSFTTPLAYEPTGKTRKGRPVYRLTAQFSYDVGCEGSGFTVHVPAGFETDFASIPKSLRGIFPPNGPWAKAAVIHDFLYDTGNVSRWLADRIFFEAMGVLGVRLKARIIMYLAVRAFGWRAYGHQSTSLPDWHYDEATGWLAVNHDGRITWDQLQEIKCQAMGPSARAIEIYPEGVDVVNKGNVRHLWRVVNDFGLPDLRLAAASGVDFEGWSGWQVRQDKGEPDWHGAIEDIHNKQDAADG